MFKGKNEIDGNQDSSSGPRRLQITKINGKMYFIDQRLEEYRNVKNPHDRITFDEMWKRIQKESREDPENGN